MSLFETGIRPAVDVYLDKKSKEERDYGKYWSASSAGYCQRKVIFDRLKVPKTSEDARKTRVFEAGHIFHQWIQRITNEAGLSIAQELELQDEHMMVRGHIDDLVLVQREWDENEIVPIPGRMTPEQEYQVIDQAKRRLILYDYKTVNSRAFTWAKKTGNQMSYYHKMQLGTYMYMLRKLQGRFDDEPDFDLERLHNLEEARIMKISKDDLRMEEQQLMWSLELESEVLAYWGTLNGHWKSKVLPKCTCADTEGGFMAREAYNDYFYEDQPCSIKWLLKCIKEKKVNAAEWKAEGV